MISIIYVLTNEAMPDYVRLGVTTTNLEQTVKELNNASVPLPFTIFYACTVKDAAFAQAQIQNIFKDNRVNEKSEFFKIEASRLASALKLAEIDDITPKK